MSLRPAPDLPPRPDGHVHVVCLWSLGDVHSHQALAVLSALPVRFAGEPVRVTAVHVPRRAAERADAAARAQARELGWSGDLVCDDGAAWQAWNGRAWPTCALVDAAGRLRFRGVGAPDLARWLRAVDQLLIEAGTEGSRATITSPRTAALAERPAPGGLAVDGDRGLLWVADTAGHRLVALDLGSGVVHREVGSGWAGAEDGAAEHAGFLRPRGVAMGAGCLWVADSGNHLLRTVDPDRGEVTTAVGTGAPLLDLVGGHSGSDQALHHPWGLAAWGTGEEAGVVLAMTASHQLWRVAASDHGALPVAGDGEQGQQDGRHDHARLAQPRGVAVHGDEVWFADTGNGALRCCDLRTGNVTTRATGFALPVDVAVWNDEVLVADALTGEVSVVDPSGPRRPLCRMTRPGALTVSGDTLFVAGAEGILAKDLREGAVLWRREDLPPHPSDPRAADPEVLAPHAALLVRIALPAPAGLTRPPGAAVRMRAWNLEGVVLQEPVERPVEDLGGTATLHGAVTASPGRGVMGLEVEWVEGEGVVRLQGLRRHIPVTLAAGGGEELAVR